MRTDYSRRDDKYYNVKVYKSSCGRFWAFRKCPDCVYRIASIYREKTSGSVARSEEHPTHSVAEGFRIEAIAKRHFEKLGFKVTQTKGCGPDLICEMSGIKWTVEVKKALKTRKRQNYQYVPNVTKNRKGDDLIAVVFEEGVYINSMEDHLKRCTPCGTMNAKEYKSALINRI